MGEKEMPTKEEVECAAQTLLSIRMMLETVPMEILKSAVEDGAARRTRYMTLGPLMDLTDYQRHGEEKENQMEAQINAARTLLELKKIWRQDVPLDQRIREELDRGAPKETGEDDDG